MANKIEIMLELEKLGGLPEDKKAILAELRALGGIPGENNNSQPSQPKVDPQSLIDSMPPVSATDFSREDVQDVNPNANSRGYVPDTKNSPGMAALGSWGDSFSAGLLPRGTSFLSALLQKAQGEGQTVIEGGDKSIGDLYDENRQFNENEMANLSRDNPAASLAGTIGGFVSPGGVFSSALKGTSKIPFLQKLLQGGGLAKVAGAVGRGGLANAIYGQVSEDFDAPLADRASDAVKDFAVGAAFDGGATAIGQGAKFAGKIGKKATASLAKKVPYLGDAIENYQTGKFVNQIDDVTKKVGFQRKEVSGREFAENVDEIFKGSSKKYHETIDPIISEFGDTKVSVEKLRKAYGDILKREGLVDAAGNITDDSLELVFEQDLRPTVKRLTSQLMSLKENPTLAELNDITQKIGKVAKFNKGIRGEKDKIFGHLYGVARENLLDATGDFVGESGKNAFNAARQEISKNIRVKEGPIGKLAKQIPEDVVNKAASTGKLDYGSQVDAALSANPEYKGAIKKVVMADILSNASDQRSLAKVVTQYKDVLPKLLDANDLKQIQKIAGTFKNGDATFLQRLLSGSGNPGITEMMPRTIAPAIIRSEEDR